MNISLTKPALSPALAGAPSNTVSTLAPSINWEELEYLRSWGGLAALRRKNDAQQRNAYRNAKAWRGKTRIIGLNAAAALYWCGKRVLAEQRGNYLMPVGAMYCGKKYCAVCSKKKRNKILDRFTNYFESEAGAEMLNNYDLCLFTVTLQHSKNGLRSKPYYKELATHWRNALKYGSFKKYLAGGFYNTEHTYGKNGHHIHRHALVLIPRQYNARENFEAIEKELQAQWISRTGGSFQIDLRPLGYNAKRKELISRPRLLSDLRTHLLEVTKYITKRDKDSGIIPFEVIRAVEENARTKFYGRFGCLHRVKELNINQDLEELPTDATRQLFAVTPRVKLVKKTVEAPQKLEPELVSEVVIKQDGYNIPKLRYLNPVQIREEKYSKGKQEFNRVTPRKSKYKILEAASVTFENVVPVGNRPEDIAAWKESQRRAQYDWKTERWNKLQDGHTVKHWKQSRETLQRLQNQFFERKAERAGSVHMGTADILGNLEIIYKSVETPF